MSEWVRVGSCVSVCAFACVWYFSVHARVFLCVICDVRVCAYGVVCACV